MQSSQLTPRFHPAQSPSPPSRAERRSLLGGPSLGRLFGVPIAADWSVILIFALIAFNLGAAVFPNWHPQWSPFITWATAFGAAILFLGSILLHELSHAVVARAQGIRVRGITLFLFGGATQMEGEPPSPKSEFFTAIVGPITSLVIGTIATFAGSWLAGPSLAQLSPENPEAVARTLSGLSPWATLLLWLGPINILLALFNIVPGFPLDGGRVLRSLLWGLTGDFSKATRWAAALGRGLAWALMAFGVLLAFGGDFLSGLWLILIGWFLSVAASASYQQTLIRQTLKDVVVGDLMRTQMLRVPPELAVSRLVDDYLMNTDQHCFPVETRGQLVGLVCFEDVKRHPKREWESTPIARIMTPRERLTSVQANENAASALERLSTRGVNQLPVLDGDQLLGLVQREDLLKYLSLQTASSTADRLPQRPQRNV